MGAGKAPAGNIFENLPARSSSEVFTELLSSPSARIERIVSTGQATPAGEWYDQAWTEWVLIIVGSARLQIEGEGEARYLQRGDYIELPAHCRHRVEWTDADQPTIWLAIHLRP